DGAPLLDPQAQGTLFEAPNASALESAFWLEIKTVGQHTINGPFERYSAELLAPVSRDIKKLANDNLIYHAGLLLVLFNENEAVARVVLVVWEACGLKRGWVVGGRLTRYFGITDGMGNGYMSCALFPIRRFWEAELDGFNSAGGCDLRPVLFVGVPNTGGQA